MSRIGNPIARWLEQDEYDYIYDRVPRLCVDILIVSGEGLLLSKRNIEPYRGLWHLPGGRVWFMEKLEQAVHRVVKSECGLAVELIENLGVTETDDTLTRDKAEHLRHSVSIVYAARVTGGELQANSQSSSLSFFQRPPPLDEMHPVHGPFLHESWDDLRNLTESPKGILARFLRVHK